MTSLPQIAYSFSIAFGQPVLMSHAPETGRTLALLIDTTKSVEELNVSLGVTMKQAAALTFGIAHGFDNDYCNPDNWTEQDAKYMVGLSGSGC